MRTTLPRFLHVLLTAALAAAAAGCLTPTAAPEATEAAEADEAYRGEILKWREDRETRLKADGGWLTVAGLFWLKEGANRFGTAPDNEIVLPEGSSPPLAGVLEHRGGVTTIRMQPGAPGALLEGAPITTRELKSDADGQPDVVKMGRLWMQVIKRGERYGIRLKDMRSRLRQEFTGLRWYPAKVDYRIAARWESYDPPKEIPVPNVIGTTERLPGPGAAVFTVAGQVVRLEPVLEEPNADQLFFIFKDATSGEQTYPAGRFLYSELPKDGAVVLDFNKAYNPPCAFTPYATCPLPPDQNRLKVRVEAGELSYGRH